MERKPSAVQKRDFPEGGNGAGEKWVVPRARERFHARTGTKKETLQSRPSCVNGKRKSIVKKVEDTRMSSFPRSKGARKGKRTGRRGSVVKTSKRGPKTREQMFEDAELNKR